MKNLVSTWLFLMIAGIFTAGCVYISFQQTQRSGANIPAVMVARQAVFELQHGKSPQEALPAVNTDMTSTISPFVFIYDKNQNLVASSLIGSQFTYPKGCLAQIDKNGDNRVSWQPQRGLRFATVGLRYENGYVVGAYSLSESENSTSRFVELLFTGCILYVLGCAVLLLGYHWITKPRSAKILDIIE